LLSFVKIPANKGRKKMLQTNRFTNAARSLNQINAWQKELEEKENKQRMLILEKKRKEQELKKIKP
jgi:hypothetical protein